MDHTNCDTCKNSLTGLRYVVREDKPTCLSCYEQNYADKCETCKKPIGMDAKDLTYKGKHWHEECFNCWTCKDSLANQDFVGKDDGLYCTTCYDRDFATKCDVCNKIFKHGMQKFEYNGKKYHNSCLICSACKKPIGNNSLVPGSEDDEIYCMKCFNNNFAIKCGKCKEMLISGGVAFREVQYHKECFACDGCDVELSNKEFIVKDGSPYCTKCYICKFSKNCDQCSEPIHSVGSAQKYVAFDKRQWHAECFMCSSPACGRSLVGRGFLVANGQVVCPDCGKNTA